MARPILFEAITPDGMGHTYDNSKEAEGYFWDILKNEKPATHVHCEALRFLKVANIYHVIYPLPDNITLTLGWIIVRP